MIDSVIKLGNRHVRDDNRRRVQDSRLFLHIQRAGLATSASVHFLSMIMNTLVQQTHHKLCALVKYYHIFVKAQDEYW